MNKRLFSIALLISTLPLFSFAESLGVSLNEGDFKSAKPIVRKGQNLLSLKLSKSGKVKFKKLNERLIGHEIATRRTGETANFHLKDVLRKQSVEVGLSSREEIELVAKSTV